MWCVGVCMCCVDVKYFSQYLFNFLEISFYLEATQFTVLICFCAGPASVGAPASCSRHRAGANGLPASGAESRDSVPEELWSETLQRKVLDQLLSSGCKWSGMSRVVLNLGCVTTRVTLAMQATYSMHWRMKWALTGEVDMRFGIATHLLTGLCVLYVHMKITDAYHTVARLHLLFSKPICCYS